jgi:hypothetical protein
VFEPRSQDELAGFDTIEAADEELAPRRGERWNHRGGSTHQCMPSGSTLTRLVERAQAATS